MCFIPLSIAVFRLYLSVLCWILINTRVCIHSAQKSWSERKKNHWRGITFVTFCLIWNQKREHRHMYRNALDTLVSHGKYFMYFVLHIKCEPESVLLSGDDGVMHCFLQKDSLFNYKSALLAENVERVNVRVSTPARDEQTHTPRNRDAVNAVLRWMKNKQVHAHSVCYVFCRKDLWIYCVHSYVFISCCCVFFNAWLCLNSKMFDFIACPRTILVFLPRFFLILSFPLVAAVFAPMFH